MTDTLRPMSTAPTEGWFFAVSDRISSPGHIVIAAHYNDKFGGQFDVMGYRGYLLRSQMQGWMPIPDALCQGSRSVFREAKP